MSKDFLYKSQASKAHFFDDMKRCKFTIKYKKTIDKIKNIGYNNLIVKESSWRRDPFMFASVRSDEEPLHI